MSLDLLVNKGVATLNLPDELPEKKTVVVVGVARGGTSIVAGVLHHLGVFLGTKYNPPVFEDMRLSLAFEGKSEESFEQVIDEYNRQHEVWGWKRPSTLHDLPRVASTLRNPLFIYIFRDLFSIANRNSISMKSEIVGGLQHALDDYAKILRFMATSKLPSMLVSSDKAVRYREALVDGVCQFVGLQPDPQQYEKAISFISPDPKQYLEATRITRTRGTVNQDLLRTGLLRGWARAAYHADPVQVEVLVNNEMVATIMADIYREHLDKPEIHPTGMCGFEIDLKTLGIKPNAEIRVRVKDDVVDLHGAPISYKNLKNWLTTKEWRLAKEKRNRQQ